MNIASIESIPLRIPFTAGGRSDAAVWGKAGLQTADSLIVKVTTDTGVVGWGESFGFTAVPAVKVVIDSILAPEIIGRDASLLEKQMLDEMRGAVFGRLLIARSVFDPNANRRGNDLRHRLGENAHAVSDNTLLNHSPINFPCWVPVQPRASKGGFCRYDRRRVPSL